jgi:hypothetical protein
MKYPLDKVIENYRLLLKKRTKESRCKGKVRIGNRSKNRILDFYLKNKRWPDRKSDNKRERTLGTRFENYLSKTSLTYDSAFRGIVLATGRKASGKRKHDIEGFKKEILAFVETNGRVPSTSYEYQTTEGEARLRHKLDYYTRKKNDTTLLGMIYETDKCHLSHIPMKYRAIINRSLNVEKPLIRLSNRVLARK